MEGKMANRRIEDDKLAKVLTLGLVEILYVIKETVVFFINLCSFIDKSSKNKKVINIKDYNSLFDDKVRIVNKIL